jgi:hypothetical protein
VNNIHTELLEIISSLTLEQQVRLISELRTRASESSKTNILEFLPMGVGTTDSQGQRRVSELRREWNP